MHCSSTTSLAAAPASVNTCLGSRSGYAAANPFASATAKPSAPGAAAGHPPSRPARRAAPNRSRPAHRPRGCSRTRILRREQRGVSTLREPEENRAVAGTRVRKHPSRPHRIEHAPPRSLADPIGMRPRGPQALVVGRGNDITGAEQRRQYRARDAEADLLRRRALVSQPGRRMRERDDCPACGKGGSVRRDDNTRHREDRDRPPWSSGTALATRSPLPARSNALGPDQVARCSRRQRIGRSVERRSGRDGRGLGRRRGRRARGGVTVATAAGRDRHHRHHEYDRAPGNTHSSTFGLRTADGIRTQYGSDVGNRCEKRGRWMSAACPRVWSHFSSPT